MFKVGYDALVPGCDKQGQVCGEMDLLLDGQQLARVLEVEFCGKGEQEVPEDNDVDFDMDLGGSDDMGLLYSKV